MALSTTGITTSMVASAIGEPSNDVGTLFTSSKVNEFGFNCPENNVQSVIWGMPATERATLSPKDPNYTFRAGYPEGYHLGAFRGYDHYWKAYTFDGFGMQGTEYTEPLTFTIGLSTASTKLDLLPEPSPATDHVFKVEFGRNFTDFSRGLSTVIYSALNVNYPSTTFQIQANNPPDYATKGVLNAGNTFYIKVSHTSSPDRRWKDPDVIQEIFSFVVPNTAYTEVKDLQNMGATAVEQSTPFNVEYFIMSADLYADFSAAGSVTVLAEMSTTSDLSVNKVQSSQTISVPKNTTPGTASLVDHLEFDFSSTSISQWVGVGSTIYYRFSLNGVSQGIRTTTVASTLPQA